MRSRSWLFIVPAFIVLALVLVYPVLYNLWISVHVDRFSEADGSFAGAQNYATVLRNGALLNTLGRTFVFTFGSLALQFIVAMVAALALEEFPRFSKVARPLLLLPWVLPGVAVAAVWLSMLDPLTGLNAVVSKELGLEPAQWFASSQLAMFSLIVVNAWRGMPYWLLMISAGLKLIPQDLKEAARMDGTNYAQMVWHVYLPGIRRVLATTSLLAFILTFNVFDLAYLITDGGPQGATTTLPYAIWESAVKFNRFDQGAVYSILSLLLSAVAIVIYVRIVRRASRVKVNA